jgi:SPP1 family phage portal protein
MSQNENLIQNGQFSIEIKTADDGRLNGQQVAWLVNKADKVLKPQYLNNQLYVSGTHPEINKAPAKDDPDNRLSIPIPRKAIKTMSGYLAKPGNVIYTTEDEAYTEYLTKVFKENYESLETNRDLEESLTNGRAFEIHYYVDGELPQFKFVDPKEIITIYSANIKPELLYFIRYWTVVELDAKGTEKIVYYADVYYPDVIQSWKVEGVAGMRSTGVISGEYTFLGEVEHFYGVPPLVEYNISLDKSNFIDHVKPINDSLDKLYSYDVANEIEKLANAYLALADKIDDVREDENGETALDKMKRTKIIELQPGEGKSIDGLVKYIIKNIDTSFLEFSAKNLERLIYQMLSVVNFDSEDFANAASGISLAYKLLGMETQASVVEANFQAGLQQRITLINNIAEVKTAGFQSYPVNITMKRNLPFDKTESAEIIEKLWGKLSKQTLIKMFGGDLVDSVEEELKRITEEQDQAFERNLELQTKVEEPQLDEDDEDGEKDIQ